MRWENSLTSAKLYQTLYALGGGGGQSVDHTGLDQCSPHSLGSKRRMTGGRALPNMWLPCWLTQIGDCGFSSQKCAKQQSEKKNLSRQIFPTSHCVFCRRRNSEMELLFEYLPAHYVYVEHVFFLLAVCTMSGNMFFTFPLPI